MILTKELIHQELKKDGSLKNKTHLTKIYSTQELYNFYFNIEYKKCEICSKETKFQNFKLGYDIVCSRSCRTELKSKSYIPEYNNIITLEELKIFLLDIFSNTNTSNKLNNSFFINNNYIKELNTILLYLKTINEDILTIKIIHELLFGCGICVKCSKRTKFNGFNKEYNKCCSDNICAQSLFINSTIEKEYVLNNFIKNGKFLINKMMDYYSVSYSFVNKWKVKNAVLIENKHKKYSFGEELLFSTYKDICNIKTNSRSIINPYEIDLVLESLKFLDSTNRQDNKLCIEYDGLLFHSNGNSYPGNCSKRYKIDLIPKNYELLTIFENEILDKTKQKIWFSIINNKLNLNKKINLKDSIIKNITNEINLKDFMLNNSLDAYIKSEINLGLYLAEELYSVISFNRTEDKEYMITNLSTKIDYSTNYSILISYFEDNYNPESIEYYSNRRYLTSINGFNLIENTEPNCFKFKVNENILEQCVFNVDLLDDYRVIFDYGYSIFRKQV